MRQLPIFCFGLALIFSLGCACQRATVPGTESAHLAHEAELLAYDRQEERFHALCAELSQATGEDPQIIEARELASGAEELYLVGEFDTAMEMLREAIQLLEEKRRIEESRL
jgi:hypothetical protein